MTAPADTPWMKVHEVVAYGRIGRRDVLGALGDGSLRGHQTKPGAHWRVHRDDVDAWLRGEAPPSARPSFTKQRKAAS